MISPSPLISKSSKLLLALLCLHAWSCATNRGNSSAVAGHDDALLDGQIEYPFAEDSKRIGRDQKNEPFVIKSMVGNTEYEVQLPGGSDDYDVQIPLSEIRTTTNAPRPTSRLVATAGASSYSSSEQDALPQTTDREFEQNMPKITEPDDRGLVEGALGIGESNGPKQSPSYTMRLTKINDLYMQRQYELALVEVNNLLAFYATDPRLYKMKGTILIKMRNFKMAEAAWSRGLEFSPNDKMLGRALASLRSRLLSDNSRTSNGEAPPVQEN